MNTSTLCGARWLPIFHWRRYLAIHPKIIAKSHPGGGLVVFAFMTTPGKSPSPQAFSALDFFVLSLAAAAFFTRFQGAATLMVMS
jgi:hypothetical protein